MANTPAPAGEWTTLPASTTDMWTQTHGGGIYVDTTGTPPADPADANVLPDGGEIVIAPGKTVNVWPIRSDRATNVRTQEI